MHRSFHVWFSLTHLFIICECFNFVILISTAATTYRFYKKIVEWYWNFMMALSTCLKADKHFPSSYELSAKQINFQVLLK